MLQNAGVTDNEDNKQTEVWTDKTVIGLKNRAMIGNHNYDQQTERDEETEISAQQAEISLKQLRP